jgi:hypothetical protein
MAEINKDTIPKKNLTNEERKKFLNEKLKEVEKIETEELAIDFDEALKEYESKNAPHKIKFKGKIFNIPFTMPFTFGMFYMRYCLVKKEDGVYFEIPTDLMSEFIEKMFGQDFLDGLEMEKDVEMNFIIGVLIPKIMELWGSPIKSKVPEKNG